MMTQDEFLERLWKEVIRAGADGKWIDAAIKRGPKSKVSNERRFGELLKKFLDKGISKREIVELLEFDRHESLFEVLSMIEERGSSRQA